MPMPDHVKPRRLSLAALLAVATVSVVVAAGCGAGQETTVAAPVTAQTLSQTAKASATETSGRFTFDMTMTAPGLDEELGFNGEGAFDTVSERASLRFDMSAFAQLMGAGLGALAGGDAAAFGDPDAWKLELLQDGRIVYLNFPLLADQLPGGKSWVRIDVDEAAQVQGFDLEQLKELGSNDPRDLLKLLEAVAGDIETVGREEVRGAETTRYRATIDLRRYAELFPPEKREEAASMFDSILEQTGLGEMPVDVWLDDEQRVRKVELSLSATQPGTSQSFGATVTIEMFDYGAPVELDLPPDDEVVEASELMKTTP